MQRNAPQNWIWFLNEISIVTPFYSGEEYQIATTGSMRFFQNSYFSLFLFRSPRLPCAQLNGENYKDICYSKEKCNFFLDGFPPKTVWTATGTPSAYGKSVLDEPG